MTPEERKEYMKEYNRKYYAANKEREKARRKAYYYDNQEQSLAVGRAYKKKNKAVVNASVSKYRASKLQATPSWADLEAIKDVYIEAEYHQMQVDHIVPLQGEKVCGLHVWDNLQLLTAAENQSKGNSFTI